MSRYSRFVRAKVSHSGAEELILSVMIPRAICHGNFHLQILILAHPRLKILRTPTEKSFLSLLFSLLATLQHRPFLNNHCHLLILAQILHLQILQLFKN
jgi:hypothetical protein